MERFRTILAGPIARGTVVSLVIRVAGIGLGVVQAILTARLLGPDGYGAIAFVLSISMIAATVVLAGTEMLAVREVAKYSAERDFLGLRGFLRAIRIMLVGAIVLGVAAMAILLANLTLAEEFRRVIIYAIVIFPILALVLQFQGVLCGLGHTALSQIPFLFLRPLVLVGVLAYCFAFSIGIGPEGYLYTVVVGAALALILAGWTALRLTPATDVPPQMFPAATLFGLSAPFLAISVLGLLLAEINTLMLAWWTTPEETGLFQPIARIAPLMMLGAQAASVRYAPRVSELWARGEIERVAKITRLYTLATTGFAAIFAFCVILFDGAILGLFGEAFAVHTIALWWVAGAQVFNAACGPVALLLTMTDRANSAVWPQALTLVLVVSVGYFLIPALGVLGAAITFSAATVFWNVLMLIAVVRKMKIDPSIFGMFAGKDGTGS